MPIFVFAISSFEDDDHRIAALEGWGVTRPLDILPAG